MVEVTRSIVAWDPWYVCMCAINCDGCLRVNIARCHGNRIQLHKTVTVKMISVNFKRRCLYSRLSDLLTTITCFASESACEAV